MSGRGRLLRWVGLGLVAGAVLQGEAAGQDTTRTRRDTTRVRRDSAVVRVPIPPQADTIVRRDSTPQRDSIARARLARIAADTLKAPLARAELPALVDVTRPVMQWDRAALFATGALTLLDLLERIPGVTALRAGWLSTPQIAAYLGDVSRVRVYYDGMEIEPLNPRLGGSIELGAIQLWTAEEVRIERGADEIRVHVRSWRVQRTTSYTRADVGTGDQETNLYRGFYGRRYQRGEALQVAAEQFSTTPARTGGSSNHATVMARLGWAKQRWAVDATLLRASPDRGTVLSAVFADASGRAVRDTILPAAASETMGYLRVAWGDPEGGPWVQVVAGGQQYKFTGQPAPASETPDPNVPAPDPDTTRAQTQYTIAGGVTWRGLRLSATDRLRVQEGQSYHSPMVRASLTTGPLAASALAELEGEAEHPHVEATVRVTPLRFLSFGGAAGLRGARGSGFSGVSPTLRIEGAVRVAELWLGGGMIRRDAATLSAPVIFSRRFEPRDEGQATGAFATIRGRVWGPFHADVTGMQWQDEGGFYRPRYQTRSEVFVATTLPRRFPSGNFGLLASLLHEYRSNTFFPDTSGRTDVAGGYRILSGLLEIRILQAVLTYQYRNLLIENFATVPGYLLPRQTQFYGVRWEFWN